MAADLSSIPGLHAKHLGILAESLSISTPSELLRADRRVIHTAMRRLRPRPTLAEISTWQDTARDVAAASDPEWEQVAAFVVSFEQQEDEDGLKRRVAAEQAEHAPPVPREVWPQWQCAAVCTWMLRQLHAEREQVDEHRATDQSAGGGQSQDAVEATDQSDNGTPPLTTAVSTPRPALAINRANLLRPGKTPLKLVPPVDDEIEVDVPSGARLKVTVSGSPAGQPVNVALRVRRPGHRTLTPHSPVSTTTDASVEIDLSNLPPGTHMAVLAIWTDDGSAAPNVRRLPRLHVGGSASR